MKEMPCHVRLGPEIVQFHVSASTNRIKDFLLPNASPIIAIPTSCAQGSPRPFEIGKSLLLQK